MVLFASSIKGLMDVSISFDDGCFVVQKRKRYVFMWIDWWALVVEHV